MSDHRRIMNMVSRGVIASADDEPGIQLEQVSLVYEEDKVSIERFQNYGFSSSPPADSEALVVFVGGGRDHGIIVATDDRQRRFTGLQPGECVIYNANTGDSLVLKNDGSAELQTDKVVIKSEEIEIEAPEIRIKGDIELDGALNVGAGPAAARAASMGTSLFLAWRDESGAVQALAPVMVDQPDPTIGGGRWLYLLPGALRDE